MGLCFAVLIAREGRTVTGQLWSISTTTIQVRPKATPSSPTSPSKKPAKSPVKKPVRSLEGSILFTKTLMRKDVSKKDTAAAAGEGTDAEKKDEEEGDFSSKAQIMTLLTTDVDRVSDFAWHLFTLAGACSTALFPSFTRRSRSVIGSFIRWPSSRDTARADSPIVMAIGTVFLYKPLGASSFFGLAAMCIFLLLDRFAGKVVVGPQDSLMKARDERLSLMNQVDACGVVSMMIMLGDVMIRCRGGVGFL